MASAKRNAQASATVDYSIGAAIRQNAITAALTAMAERDANVQETEVAAPSAVELAQTAVDQIEAALAVLGSGHAATPALQEQLSAAQAVLGDAQAQAARDSERLSEIEQVTALAANLPTGMLDVMLAAIESKYAPVAEVEVDVPVAPVSGRKPVGKLATARNIEVAATLAADTELQARVDATIAAFKQYDQPHISNSVHPQAGTRYASILASASHGAGVANYADFCILVTAIRQTLALPPHNLPIGGQTVADKGWTTGTGNYAANGGKFPDTLRCKFSDGRAFALCADGRFRLQPLGTAGARFTHLDASALKAFEGGATAAPVAPTPPTVPAAPIVPTAPDVVALPTGGLTRTARCQHCPTKNVVGEPQCRSCGATDWHVA
jgi:hypothetical protein